MYPWCGRRLGELIDGSDAILTPVANFNFMVRVNLVSRMTSHCPFLKDKTLNPAAYRMGRDCTQHGVFRRDLSELHIKQRGFHHDSAIIHVLTSSINDILVKSMTTVFDFKGIVNRTALPALIRAAP
jgi:hypothetical protein